MYLHEEFFLELSDYERIMEKETEISLKRWSFPEADEMHKEALFISEYARNSFVLKAYNNIFGLTRQKYAFESDGARTNLMTEILDSALSFRYGTDMKLPEGYTYRGIMEAARRFDLPDNLFGSSLSNDDTEEETAKNNKRAFQDYLSNLTPSREVKRETEAEKVILEMTNKSTEVGRMIYLAYKVSDIIAALQGNEDGRPALMKPHSHHASKNDKKAMKKCDFKIKGGHYASEIWTIDYFEGRHLIDYDDSGYFTALIVMRTLQVNQRWYTWREQLYEY